jgi:hypothetical protein
MYLGRHKRGNWLLLHQLSLLSRVDEVLNRAVRPTRRLLSRTHFDSKFWGFGFLFSTKSAQVFWMLVVEYRPGHRRDASEMQWMWSRLRDKCR